MKAKAASRWARPSAVAQLQNDNDRMWSERAIAGPRRADDLPSPALHTYLELWQDEFMRQNSRPSTIEQVVAVLDRIESCRP